MDGRLDRSPTAAARGNARGLLRTTRGRLMTRWPLDTGTGTYTDAAALATPMPNIVVPTGLRDLDSLLVGGLRPGQVALITSRPQVGRSVLAVGFSLAALRAGRGVVHLAHDDVRLVVRRLRSAQARVPLDTLEVPDTYQAARLALADAHLAKAVLQLGFLPRSGLEIDQLLRGAPGRYSLLLIDGTFELDDGWRPSVADLKQLARRHSIVVVATTRLPVPRGQEAPLPQLSEIGCPADAAEEADLVLALHRGDAHGRGVDVGEAVLTVQLHRGGPTTTVPLVFSGMTARFHEPITYDQRRTVPPESVRHVTWEPKSEQTAGMAFHLPQALAAADDSSALDLLARYYGPALGEPNYYAGSAFDTWDTTGSRARDTNRFTADDLLAITCLSVSVPPAAAHRLLVGEADRFADLLHQVGEDRDLAEQAEPIVDDWVGWTLLEELWALDGVGPTTASKLFARKRPRLRPIYDAVVAEVTGTRLNQWEPLRQALRADGLALHHRLIRLRGAAGLPAEVSALRVLDVICWMEGKDEGR